MRCLTIFVLSLLLLLCSCNNNDEPPTETMLSVSEAYIPCTVSVNDTEFVNKIKEWSDKKYIVNDLSELPDDPLGFSDAYKKMDFNQYTLLITYDIHNWEIDTYRNRYYFDNIERTYNWAICVGTSTVPDDNAETWYFTRYAILVKKISQDAKIKMWFSLGAINWDFK